MVGPATAHINSKYLLSQIPNLPTLIFLPNQAETMSSQILVFGPQTLSAVESTFTQLRETVTSDESFEWILDVVEELPGYYKSLIENILPDFDTSQGLEELKWLQSWFKSGTPRAHSPLPNALVKPLVVIAHLTQFCQALQHDPESFKDRREAVGLCTGFLSAVAVATSTNQSQLQLHGATAIRLAMLLGAIVDIQNSSADIDGGDAVSVSAFWPVSSTKDVVEEVLHQLPEAYISVFSDERRATITAPRSHISSLIRNLRAADVVAAEIGLRGRYHWHGHSQILQQFVEFCNTDSNLKFPSPSKLILTVRSTVDGQHITSTNGSLHEIVIRAILVDRSDWYNTFKAVLDSSKNSQFKLFGPNACLPASLISQIKPRLQKFWDIQTPRIASSVSSPAPVDIPINGPDNRIAVVGMSCNIPGANNLQEFWDILCKGESQHVEVPTGRFGFKSIWRDVDPNKKWYGNFLQDYDAFDHKFFKKSPREMASADPQHRMMLQVIYQALEQSGYFTPTSQKIRDCQSPGGPRIGCYVGLGIVDYENNAASHAANAFTVTGNLASFAAGKVSHYFGWTGPSMAVNTACSSSAVAIHLACQAILTGECTAAVAGGVNTMSSPEWFHNLAGASFLSPTGQCKPFDVKADGYCRAEAAGAVFLKKYSDAVRDGDPIHGVLAATSVYQNRNCTAITVPDSGSLADMFSHVVHTAGLKPSQVSAVEAHGTGTAVGDPAEYEAIRRVFGGKHRSDILSLGSVKGLVGHSESASGVISLIKALLMISHGIIPPQASFDTVNPALKMSPDDKIRIDTTCRPWETDFRAILINNYGASGTNASMMVTESPSLKRAGQLKFPLLAPAAKYPFIFTALDDRSIGEYSHQLLQMIRSNSNSSNGALLADLSFWLGRQANRSLSKRLTFTCKSIEELEKKLNFIATGDGEESITSTTIAATQKPVILCFGGQVSKFIGLDQRLYNQVAILRLHLDECSRICEEFGVNGGIFPEIFQREPIDDIVKLQLALFSIQYSCAKSWIDCGVQVAAVVGHSFGELTALCVSGIVSLEDAIRMIHGRSTLIKQLWGQEKGGMIATEADLDMVKQFIAAGNETITNEAPALIACYNGPRSFTLAGSTKAMDKLEELRSTDARFSSSIKTKRLNVTNAFHSTLTEPLLQGLRDIGKEITFNIPSIPFQRASELEYTALFANSYLAEHMREPVWFNNAVQRLSEKYPSAIWLEAGSSSTITVMASRALAGNPSAKSSHFQAVNITATSNTGLDALSEATVALWKQGVSTLSWLHHPLQTPTYSSLLIPPYQFEKSRHWLDLKTTPTILSSSSEAVPVPSDLWTLVGYQDNEKRHARFTINTESIGWQQYVKGHKVAEAAPLCPSILQISVAVDAITSLCPNLAQAKLQPQLDNMSSTAPMTLNPSKLAWIDANVVDKERNIWDWKIISQGKEAGSRPTTHITGRLTLRSTDDGSLQSEFNQYERLVGSKRHSRLLYQSTVDASLQGHEIYEAFADTVDYSPTYRGIQRIVGKDDESAGRVSLPHDAGRWVSVGLADSFCQVAGIFVNCMTGRSDKEVCISDYIEKWIRSPKLLHGTAQPEVWDVYACHSRPSPKQFLSDVFIFDARNGELAEVIFGIRYQRLPKAAFARMISDPSQSSSPDPIQQQHEQQVVTNGTISNTNGSIPAINVFGTIRNIIVDLSGLEPSEIVQDAQLIELGIDSLMGMELARELELAFRITLANEDLLEIETVKQLVEYVKKLLGIVDASNGSSKAEDDLSESYTNGVDGSSTINNVDSLIIEELSTTNGFGNTESPSIEELSATSGFGNTESPSIGGLSTTSGFDNTELPSNNGFISTTDIVNIFNDTIAATDKFIGNSGLGGFVDNVLPLSRELCVVYILDAFEQLGCTIRGADAGSELNPIEHLPQHSKFFHCLFGILGDAGLVDIVEESKMVRTALQPPASTASAILEQLIKKSPEFESDYRLTQYVGEKIAPCLTGKIDGLQLLFGSASGKDLLGEFYSKSPINTAWITQTVQFLEQVLPKISDPKRPIKMLELGAGTGGATVQIVALLAKLNIAVEYTVTDISSSLVAGARKRFKEYPFMKFQVLDIEKEPPAELLHSQHIVLATSCIHATRSLVGSTTNIRNMIHPSGFLLMLEMTTKMPCIDIIFGLLEAWWLFDDDRSHALASIAHWQNALQTAGYANCYWTNGKRPESALQRVILALPLENPTYEAPKPIEDAVLDIEKDRQAVLDSYIEQYTKDFEAPREIDAILKEQDNYCVLITGATGSLGCQLVATLSSLPNVSKLICLNRPGSLEATVRQLRALESRRIPLDPSSLAKLKVLEVDTSKTSFGLSNIEYQEVVAQVTHIVHNAWPMSVTRPVDAFETQFKSIRNLISLASDIGRQGRKVSFQFISSIATVGHYPLQKGRTLVPEVEMTASSTLHSGYGEAKLVCEQIVKQTLGKYPSVFQSMIVRIGQIAGSTETGYWNPTEHLPFLIKSCQAIQALPNLPGDLSWCPSDVVAATLSELLLDEASNHQIYHIENPSRQPWNQVLDILSDTLNIPLTNIVSYDDWISKVKESTDKANVARLIIDFFEQHFERMSCGRLVLDTKNSRAYSTTLASQSPVSEASIRKYIAVWKEMGFLQ